MGCSPHVGYGKSSHLLLVLPDPLAKTCHETTGCYSSDQAYVTAESRDALSLGNLIGERSHFVMRLGVVIRDSSLDSPIFSPLSPAA